MKFKKYKMVVQQIIDIEVDDDTTEQDIKREIKQNIPYSSFGSAGSDFYVRAETRDSIKIISLEFVGNKNYSDKE